MKFRVFYFFLLITVSSVAYAEIIFSDLTINDDNTVLFNTEATAPEYRTYLTAFTANINENARTNTITQLTFYPEHIAYLPSLGQLQILNRFGLFHSNSDFEDIGPLDFFPSFETGADIRTGKINTVSTSPDGRYIVHFKEKTAARGQLLLTSLVDGSSTVISTNVELNLNELPLSWSPDSNFFIYQKNSQLYYFGIGQFEDGRQFDEDFRTIGKGQMSNVQWGSNSELYYLNGSLIYQILSVEFLVQSIYQDFLRIGRIIGKIPFAFDPNFDRFWISPDKTRVLLDKGRRNLYLYPLQTNEYAGASLTIELPYLYLPINVSIGNVLWSQSEILTIMVEGVFNGERNSRLYRLDLSRDMDIYSFEKLSAPDMRDIFFSPNEKFAVVLTENHAVIYNYETWKPTRRIRHDNIHHLVFINEDEVLLAGGETIERYNLNSNERKFIAFSRSEAMGFSSSNGEILVQTDDRAMAFDTVTGRWFERNSFRVEPEKQTTTDYRIYLENLASGSYKNMVMIRQVNSETNSPRTTSLVNPPRRRYEPFPEREEPRDPAIFSHGSRIRRREVSLVFNAIHSVLGLNEILRTLDDYNITATFFLNGDFIRRYPGAVQEIARSRHEVGSLFNTYFDIANSRVRVTNDFIREGLIKNEDDYFDVTGEEMSLIWHAPYYYADPEIVSATESLNYTYVGRDVDSLDWVSAYDRNGASRLYFSSAQLVERIIDQKKPGSIISMTIGTVNGNEFFVGREDYLFQNLDILINNLLEQGYSIVPVSTLIDNAE